MWKIYVCNLENKYIYLIVFVNVFSNTNQVFASGLQMTDVELDARVTALEENGGASPQNGEQYTNIYVILSKLSTTETKSNIFNIFFNFRNHRLPFGPDILRHNPIWISSFV